MNEDQQQRWRSEVLDRVLVALAGSPRVVESLIFKGARILNLRLGTEVRQSRDLDSNLTREFEAIHPEPSRQCDYLETEIGAAIRGHFAREEPVRFALLDLKARLQTPGGHPQGWDGIVVSLQVEDLKAPRSSRLRFGLPRLGIDIAAPEELSERSVSPLAIGDAVVRAYTLERIAGEKLRAFLSSLPEYQRKIGGDRRGPVRVKDIYDVARILQSHPPSEEEFWHVAGGELWLACRSRLVDCKGMETFAQNLGATREIFAKDATIPKDVSFDAAWADLEMVIARFEREGLLPFEFPLVPGNAPGRGQLKE